MDFSHYHYPVIGLAGSICIMVSLIFLVAHYKFGYEIKGYSWRYGKVTVNFFWFSLIVGVLFLIYFLWNPAV